MKCTQCQEKTEVMETRVMPEQERWSKRRRKCLSCEHIFWTVEMPAEDVVLKEENEYEIEIKSV